ncbi:MAG: DegV family protein [Ruminococcaceae bacterium]|nr:DegV family protein [Oscillospiraceae bacterium]
MSKVRIMADTVCDLSEELKRRYEITTVPLYVTRDGVTYRDGIDITQHEVFEHYRTTGKLCSTAAINVEDFSRFFQEQVKTGEEIIFITISSEFSSTYQNACIASEDYEGVYVVDSRNLSTGEGLVAVAAAKYAQQELSASEIVTKLYQEIIPNVDASFFVANIEYLHKGGRCSSIAALGANLLKLKPCIDVIDGKMKVTKKYRGAMDKCMREYVKDRLSQVSGADDDLIFVTHTCSADFAAAAAGEIKKLRQFEEIAITEAGCTVACHCGEDTLGILFIRK